MMGNPAVFNVVRDGALRDDLLPLRGSGVRVSPAFRSTEKSSGVTVQANAGDTTIIVADGTRFFIGQGILIYDTAGQREPCNITDMIGNVLTIQTSLANTYLLTNNPTVRGRYTAGIQEAINDIPMGDGTWPHDYGYGNVVYIPPGNYVIDGLFADPAKTVYLKGGGSMMTNLSLRAGANQHVISVGRAGSALKQRFWLKDVQIHGNQAAQVGNWDGVNLDGDTHGMYIQDCKVMQCRRDAIYLGGVRDAFIKDCELEECLRNGLSVVGSIYYIFIHHNYFHANTISGISVDSSAHGIQILGNDIAFNGDHGVGLSSASHYANFVGNQVYSNSRTASGARQGLFAASKKTNITGNTFYRNPGDAQHMYDVFVADADAIIVGNFLRGWALGPIYLSNPAYKSEIGHNITD